ncbi:MAG: VWA domain-containing protein [Polyangiaceae bacterium]|nr:VWA domain-containing protein [Polyangiaceae bacterium]
MIVPFLYELRRRKVKVGTQEILSLARAMRQELHGQSLTGFYYVARAVMIHREQDYDAFDQAFSAHFKGVTEITLDVFADLLDWLQNPQRMHELSEEERQALQSLDMEEVRHGLAERLQRQKERHDGGNRWIGTGGTSPFGTGGQHPSGVRLGGGGGRGAMGVADARMFAPYRSDLVLDVRQMEVALRKLRAFLREGLDEELDIDETIAATARNGGELEMRTRPPRKPNVRVLLLMDVGGSMDPYSHAVSQLFSAAKRASNLREVRSYYFHNCVYGKVYSTEAFGGEPIRVADLLHQLDARWRLILVGDASMHPAELLGTSPWDGTLVDRGTGAMSGLAWLQVLAEHFPRCVWLNPEPPRYWEIGTCNIIRQIFPMYHLTLDGLGEAVRQLSRKG